ncbi:MAG: rhomboid family intramembrane serine protease, partial [Pseudomonadota bacterium]
LNAPPAALTPLTAMFLHGGWMHFLGNMAFLYVFGDNVEDAMGRFRFLVFYALCGVAAAVAHAFGDLGSRIPMIGASGAIAGVLGAYLLLYPRARVLTLFPVGPIFFWKRVPAALMLVLWFGLQFVQSYIQPAGGGGVAHGAHIGGFIAGMALIPLFKRRDVRLFAKPAPKTPSTPARPLGASRLPRVRESWRKPRA